MPCRLVSSLILLFRWLESTSATAIISTPPASSAALATTIPYHPLPIRPTFKFLFCDVCEDVCEVDADANPLLLIPVAKAIVAIDEFLMNFLLSILLVVNYQMVNNGLMLINKTYMLLKCLMMLNKYNYIVSKK